MTDKSSMPREHNRTSRGWAVAFLGLWTGGTVAALAGLWLLGSVQAIRRDLPPVPAPSDIALSATVVDRNGLLLRPFTIDDGRWRLPATIADVDPLYFQMLFAYEDEDFRNHAGVDWLALLRAAGQYIREGEIISGGSTLTMQVARLIDGEDTRTLLRQASSDRLRPRDRSRTQQGRDTQSLSGAGAVRR